MLDGSEGGDEVNRDNEERMTHHEWAESTRGDYDSPRSYNSHASDPTYTSDICCNVQMKFGNSPVQQFNILEGVIEALINEITSLRKRVDEQDLIIKRLTDQERTIEKSSTQPQPKNQITTGMTFEIKNVRLVRE